eukprot:SAG31_NODE_1899_length_6960_cov_18.360880_7_plen_138_part_00
MGSIRQARALASAAGRSRSQYHLRRLAHYVHDCSHGRKHRMHAMALLVAATVALMQGLATAEVSPNRLEAITKLKNELHTLTAEEASRRFAEVGAVHRLSKPPPRQKKIDHMVVLCVAPTWARLSAVNPPPPLNLFL